MKRKGFIALISFILLVATLFSVGFKCSSVHYDAREKLAEIPKEAKYIFKQNEGITYADEYVVIKDEVYKEIESLGVKLYNTSNSSYFRTITSDDGSFMWFMIEYSRKVDKNNNRNVYQYAIGSTPLPDLDIKINCFLPTIMDNSIGLSGKVGDYLICRCRGNDNLFAIDLNNFAIINIDNDGYRLESIDDEKFVLRKTPGGEVFLRIFDKNLNKYEVSHFEYWDELVSSKIKNDYVFYYVEGRLEERCGCINYKTGEKFNQEQSFKLYQSLFSEEQLNYYGNIFDYNGQTYSWINDFYSVETLAKDKYGKEITKTVHYNKLCFTNVETNEEYQLIPTELTGDCLSAIQKIYEIYDNFEWKQVFVQNGELFFVGVNEDSFFGIATSKTSPRFVFKYNQTENRLMYVGYAMFTYSDIEYIYNFEQQ